MIETARCQVQQLTRRADFFASRARHTVLGEGPVRDRTEEGRSNESGGCTAQLRYAEALPLVDQATADMS